MIAMLFCLTIPPAPPTTIDRGHYDFANLFHAQARALVGVRTRFRIVLDSADWEWEGSTFEVQMKKGMFGNVYLAPDEDEDGADELLVSGTLRIIRQTDMKGRPFIEYRIEQAVITKR